MVQDVTQLLVRSRKGEAVATRDLQAQVYDELHRIAQSHMRQQRKGHTFSATALVHEAYIKLVRPEDVSWNDRQHFLATASKAMRYVLIDYSRRRQREKRNGSHIHLPIDEVDLEAPMMSEDLLALDDGLEALERYETRLARLVELKFFGGMTMQEIGNELGFSERTAFREWTRARAFLIAYMAGEIG